MGRLITSADIVDYLLGLLSGAHEARYTGGSISMAGHMLQSAAAAEKANAPDALITAALLHDIGHFGTDLVGKGDEGRHAEMLSQGVDRGHEQAGANFLTDFFLPAVTEPIRLHVPAKRFLAASEPDYLACLSPTTRHTLRLQGGPMSPAEAHAFFSKPYASDAVALRRWDDVELVARAEAPPSEHFRGLLEDLIAPHRQ